MTIFPKTADITRCKRVKFGIDPTFPRLHLGHLVPIRLVNKMIEEGKDVTIVLGTFTAQLGDPSGRDKTRPILSPEEVETNADSILQFLNKLLKPGFSVFRNGDFFKEMPVTEFMGIVSKFTLAHMTSRDAFQDRIAQGNSIGMHELLVPVCQGWDSVVLNSEIEIGGQDQLFNFQMARQLQEQQNQTPQACIMMPIINGTDGRKMSKSLNNCIFLDEDPNEIFGKVMSIPDDVMNEWIPLLTDAISDVIHDWHPMQKKKMLATEIVAQLHGMVAAVAAEAKFTATFSNKEIPADAINVNAGSVMSVALKITGESKAGVRRLIEAGAVKVNGEKVFNENIELTTGQNIQIGKRKFGKII